MSLNELALITNAQSRRSSSWDRTGGNVDCLPDLAPGQTATLLDTAGPGKVTHMWITLMEYTAHPSVLRDMILRIYWENSPIPSVEVPLGDFFGLGHALPPQFYMDRKYTVTAAALTVGINERSMNCYFPMPFHRHARIEIFNNGDRTLKLLYFHVDYELAPQPAAAGLFHALFRQQELAGQDFMNLDGRDNYVLLETAGRGQYVGCFLYVDNSAGGWWGEGDDMIFIDHDPKPTINGTGTEDYFGNAWCYHHSFSFPYCGCPLLEKHPDGSGFNTLYRFHIPDPIRFQKHIKVTIEHCWDAQCLNWYSSLAFWYQQEPMQSRPPLLKGAANLPRLHADHAQGMTSAGIDIPALEVPLRQAGVDVHTVFVHGQAFLSDGALRFDVPGRKVEVPIAVPADGLYRVEVKPLYFLIQDSLRLGIRGQESRQVSVVKQTLLRENDGPLVNLGNVVVTGRRFILTLEGETHMGLHQIKLRKLD